MELKFRVWIKVSQQFATWEEIKEKKNLHRLIDNPGYILEQFSGLKDNQGGDIYSGDVVYLAGYGTYTCEFPFLELYDAAAEGDVEGILGNIHQHNHFPMDRGNNND